ncbi:MAG: hypothetical protein LQ343_004637 [Gyalolechia ehrenbergii]|nr:MAG: hypothetical protein LQ343_004637 [Gyalolechia ehrenbergii]
MVVTISVDFAGDGTTESMDSPVDIVLAQHDDYTLIEFDEPKADPIKDFKCILKRPQYSDDVKRIALHLSLAKLLERLQH